LEIGGNGHRSIISSQIANAGKYHLIIAFGWWHKEHPLKNVPDPSKFVFQDVNCYAHTEDEEVVDLF